jgi:hypothetical protein
MGKNEEGKDMKLSVKGMAWAWSLLWGGGVFMVALVNYFRASYGLSFLNVVDSIYPGYHAATGLASVFIGTGYALFDGAVGGALIAWLYNRLT